MDHSVEAYLRRQNIETLKFICMLPEKDLMDEDRSLALEILNKKLQESENKCN